MNRRRFALSIKLSIAVFTLAYAFVTVHLIASLQDYREEFDKRFQFESGASAEYKKIIIVPKPRVFAIYFQQWDKTDILNGPSPTIYQRKEKEPRALPVYWENSGFELYPSKRLINEMSEKQETLENSEYYDKPGHNPLKPYKNHTECTPMHEWQEQAFPTCNHIHEVADLSHMNIKSNTIHGRLFEDKRLLAHGYFRDTYVVFDKVGGGDTSRIFEPITFKTLRIKRRYDSWVLDRHRMDALVMDRMTKSENIIDIYGYCGGAGLFEFGDSDMANGLEKRLTGIERIDSFSKLKFAVDVANAISDLHTVESRGNSSAIVHADIHMTQFIWVNDKLKLNDFNRCHFMFWNQTSNRESCPYIYLDYNAGLFRSPEEYAYSLQNEKIDVYSMGNVFYFLLMEEEPFESLQEDESNDNIKDMIKNGTKPSLSEKIMRASQNPSVKTIMEAIRMCHIHDYNERATASSVRDFLISNLESVSNGKTFETKTI